MQLRLSLVGALALSVSSGCVTVRVVPDVPLCPAASDQTITELEHMEALAVYPETRRYLLDEIVPYCAGVEAMRD